MAVIKAVSSKAGIGQAIDYVTKEEKTEEKLVSGLHCEAETAKEEMQATKELWEKTGGRTYKHFVQSYHKDEKITPEQAHRKGYTPAGSSRSGKPSPATAGILPRLPGKIAVSVLSCSWLLSLQFPDNVLFSPDNLHIGKDFRGVRCKSYHFPDT